MRRKPGDSAGGVGLTRLSHAMSFMSFLRERGVPVDKGLLASKLPVECDEPGSIVPVRCVWDFAYRMSRIEGIETLGFEVARRFNGVNAQAWQMVVGAPSLFMGIQALERLIRLEGNRARVWSERQGRSVLFCHRGAFDDHPGLPVMEQYFAMILVDMVRAYLGPRWQPAAIGLQALHVPRRASELFPKTHFLVGQRSHFVQASCCDLSASPRTHASVPDHADRGSPEMPLGLAASLRAILESYVSDGGMNLDMAAELTCTTRRTLQRRLRASGLTFSELQMQVRFRAITQLLSDSSIPIRDVAHEAGFDDQSHFARSFRRIAGVSPRQYRRAAGQA